MLKVCRSLCGWMGDPELGREALEDQLHAMRAQRLADRLLAVAPVPAMAVEPWLDARRPFYWKGRGSFSNLGAIRTMFRQPACQIDW